ncbi:hypothetical protein K438DRAFT_1814953 [Mycena galopus ATCC 62051]|nr:hypothetical protein K438DRAFT_1814953 [Mycena galopus ATCC 62051]
MQAQRTAATMKRAPGMDVWLCWLLASLMELSWSQLRRTCTTFKISVCNEKSLCLLTYLLWFQFLFQWCLVLI